jgi:hypothetical protein
MADQKITQRPELTSIASDDVLHVVDVSDVTDSPEGTSKKITRLNLLFGYLTKLIADNLYLGKNAKATNSDLLRGVHWGNVNTNIVLDHSTYLTLKTSANLNTRSHGIDPNNDEYIGSIDSPVAKTFIGNDTSRITLRTGSIRRVDINSERTEVFGTTRADSGELRLSDGEDSRKLVLKSSRYGIEYADINTYSSDMRIGTNDSSIIYLKDSTKNVGIGTSAPTEKLEVSGTAKAESFKLGAWTIETSGSSLVFKYNGVAKQELKSDGGFFEV